jgi:hypothetical protein
MIECAVCDNTGWVCESHIDRPWAGASSREDACECGARTPCLKCNSSDRDHLPRMPEGHRTIFDKDGWRN